MDSTPSSVVAVKESDRSTTSKVAADPAPSVALTTATAPPGETEEERETWASKLGYVLTLVGYAVGFGNIWRFPYLLHSNGGVAFLIPYSIMLAFCGIPLFFLELAVGQRMRKGTLGAWNEISPYLGGIGISCGLTCFFVELYYNTLVAWVLLYLFDSFRGTLAWKDCTTAKTLDSEIGTRVMLAGSQVAAECAISKQGSKFYWYRRVLDISPSITEPGNFSPWIFLGVMLGWVMVGAILIKGIKSSEKVVYFTAVFPYFTLVIFFIANFFFDGWKEGYTILFKPDWSKLLVPKVWLQAGSQIFFSLGVSYGCLVVFASHLPANNNCYKDAVSVSLINCGTSLFAAIVLFPTLGIFGKKKFQDCINNRLLEALFKMDPAYHGYKGPEYVSLDNRAGLINPYMIYPALSQEKGNVTELHFKNNTVAHSFKTPLVGLEDCDLENIIRNSGSGTGLVFMGFADAVLNMPVPPVWSILFFMMLLTLGIDSSFGTLEGAISPFVESKLLKLPRWAHTLITVGVLAVVSIVFCWGWGVYVLNFLDQFLANWSLLIIGMFETLGIAWIYGLARFAYDIKLMTGSRPNMFIMLCWRYISPALIFSILLANVIEQFRDGYTYSEYNKKKGDYNDPIPMHKGIVALGYLMWLGIILWIPIQAILVKFGKTLFKDQKPNDFPEDELRAERNMGMNEEEDFDKLDELVMGKSIEDFRQSRLSKTNLSGDVSVPPSQIPSTTAEA